MAICLRWRRLLTLSVACLAVLVFAAPAFADTPIVHVVQPGENLYRISLHYGVNMHELATENGIVNVDCLSVGQRLVIPRAAWSGDATSGGAGSDCYRVRPGDTLGRIAARFGTTVSQLATLNGISNPDRIWAGEMLSISGVWCGQRGSSIPDGLCTSPCGQSRDACGSCCGTSCCGTDCWRGEFFGNSELRGAPILTRWDASLQFNWGSGAPDRRVPGDNFSARWTRSQSLAEGRYRITVRADDGVRVYINSVLVVDAWQAQGAATYTQEVVLKSASVRTIIVEYHDAQGAAEISFTLEQLS